MAAERIVAAADLGASGGRVMTGRVGAGTLELHEVARFGNRPVTVHGTLHWDVLRLHARLLDGLRAAGEQAELASIGIDSWGVDYGLLDADGALLGNPVHYRDGRTAGVAERVAERIGARELYAVTGIQQLPINTLVQLTAAAGTPQLAAAATLLLIPDLLGYWLTGNAGAEITNASTTQLYDVRAGQWAIGIMTAAGLRPGLFPPLRAPGTVIGALVPAARAATGLGPSTPVVAVASHDTASAVAATPAQHPDFAYISCGTWSLVGLELASPVLTEDSRRANFSNETGLDGTIRYLRNVMGLWLLQESLRTWTAAGRRVGLDALLVQAGRSGSLRSVIDPDAPEFLAPGDMPARIAAACARTGQPGPDGPAQTVRCILDSLALAHRRAVEQAQRLSGRAVSAVHIVGGGARNELLCQLTADACGLPVLAGPVEAAALGNVLVQGRALGCAPADLAGLRALVRATQPLRRYRPAGGQARWQAAAARLAGADEANRTRPGPY
jgi:sugar (pentulose or hexulose) kinase